MHEIAKYRIAGRPRKMTKERVSLLEEAFTKGLNVSEACRYAGIARQTYYRWLSTDVDFSDRIEVLRTSPRMLAKLNIFKALEEGNIDVSRWLLERQDSEYNPKAQIEINAVTQRAELEKQVLEQELAKLTNEQLKQILRSEE